MKKTLYFILCLASLCWQCKEKNEPPPQTGPIKEIDVLDFSVPGVDAKNISIGEDIIVVHLPERYAPGNYIKPDVILGTGYSSQSPILNGITFEGQEIKLHLESTTRRQRSFNVIVVPHKAIQLSGPTQNLQLTIGPDVHVTTSFVLKGTKATVDEDEKLIYEPLMRLTNKATGAITDKLYADPAVAQKEDTLTFTFPDSTVPGEYTAEIVWGTKTELLSSQVTIKAGPAFFKRGSWHMLESDRYFEVNGFNLSSASKYEAIIQNDFMAAKRIPLKYEKPGTLSGNLPENVGLGNYKITYLENGKQKEPYLEKQWLNRYSGDDHFYIQKNRTQPIARIVTQLSRRSSFETHLGYKLLYFPALTNINRQEPILVYSETWGVPQDRNDLILVNLDSKKEYTLPFSGDIYLIFDFLSFLNYPITKDVPNGKYEVYILRGTEKSERYSQIITIN